PDDPDEREADHAADAFASHGESGTPIHRKCDTCAAEEERVHRKCSSCETEEEEKVTRKPAGPSERPKSATPALAGLESSPGQALPHATRKDYERFFNADLSQVRVHTDTSAQQAAKSIHAHAFTHHQHIYFAPNRFNPASRDGRQLLAHELTHTLQEGASRLRRDADTAPPAAASADLDTAANQIVQAIKDNDVTAAVQPLRGRSVETLVTLRDKVNRTQTDP